jgi:hypothetical protein
MKPNITDASAPAEKKEPTRRSVSVSLTNWHLVNELAKRERRGIGDQLDMVIEKAFETKDEARA